MKTSNQASERSSKLLRGSVLYFLGTFLSKALTILILPLVTLKLTTAEYGKFDLYATIVIIAVPIFTLQTIEAVFKFLFSADEKNKKKLISNLWIIIFIGSLIVGVLLFIFNRFFLSIPHYSHLFLFYCSTVLLTMYQRVARSLGLSRQFAISGVLNVLILIISQVIALIFLDAKLVGFIYTYVIANIATVIYLEFRTSSVKDFSLNHYDFQLIKELTSFGIPLIPNNISWLSVATINKILVVSYLGLGVNALYAIASRLSSALYILADVFKLAWQESAITSYNEGDSEEFYSKTFNAFFSIMVLLCAFSLPAIKITLPFLVSESFMSISTYIPIAMISAALYASVAFYGVGYLASGKTKDSFFTTLTGAIVNIIITFLLITQIGLFAPMIGTALAYLIIWVMRHIRMKDYFRVIIDYNKILKVTLIYIMTSFIYYVMNTPINALAMIVLALFIVFDNKELLKYVGKDTLKLIKSDSNP
ncbi:oligosaccharide flippase family protein [Akkermansiaceae bacterium]|nr:oligosaccharide flippase family protein [Akkermansiaceae bacterium]